jgi:hypothetical protein
VYVIVLAMWDPAKQQSISIDQIRSSYVYWLTFINSVTKSDSQLTVLTVVNFKSKVSSQQHLTELEKLVASIQTEWSSARFNFYHRFAIIDCNELSDVKTHIGNSIVDWIEQQNMNVAIDSPEEFDYVCVAAVKAELASSPKLISYDEFDSKIRIIINRTFGQVAANDKEALNYLIEIVYDQLRFSGDIVAVDKAWVVTQPNWLTRDVLGALVKAKQKQDVMTAIDIYNIASPTTSDNFSDKKHIFAELLTAIGACIRVENTNRSAVWYFPIFATHSIKEAVWGVQKKTEGRFTRIIVRRFKPKDPNMMFFPSGYLPKLITDLLQRQKLKPDLHIFHDGVVYSIVTNSGNFEYKLEVRLELRSSDMTIQVEVRAESKQSFKSHRPTPAFKKMTEIRDLIMGCSETDFHTSGEEQVGKLNWRLNLELEEFGVVPRLDKNRNEKMTVLIGRFASGTSDLEDTLFAYGCDQDEYAFDEQVYKPDPITSTRHPSLGI